MGFGTGTPIVVRGIKAGKILTAEPAIVVSDTPEELSYWWPVGTPRIGTLAMSLPRDQMWPAINRELKAGHWTLKERAWTTTRVLAVTAPGRWWAVWHMWLAGTDRFLCWYVNFQRPLLRTPIGFDGGDLDLDLIVRPDRSIAWKDEDEYEDRVRMGAITAAEHAAVEAAREPVLARVAAGLAPFDGSLLGWSPDPAWPAPNLVDGWRDTPVADAYAA